MAFGVSVWLANFIAAGRDLCTSNKYIRPCVARCIISIIAVVLQAQMSLIWMLRINQDQIKVQAGNVVDIWEVLAETRVQISQVTSAVPIAQKRYVCLVQKLAEEVIDANQ